MKYRKQILNILFSVVKSIQRRGAAQRSLTKGTSSKRAHEQSTTANPFFWIIE